MFRRLAIAVALLCASACGGAEVPTHTPEASSGTGSPPSTAERARAFVRALSASKVNELGPTVAYPLSFRLRGGVDNCPDAATATELAAWVACVHEHIGQAFRSQHSLETLAVHVYPSRSEVGEDVLRTLPNAGADDVFVRANLFGSPTNVTIVLDYQRRPSLAVRTVWAGLGHELSSSTRPHGEALLDSYGAMEGPLASPTLRNSPTALFDWSATIARSRTR